MVKEAQGTSYSASKMFTETSERRQHHHHQQQQQQQIFERAQSLENNKLQAHKSSFQSWKCVSFGCSLLAAFLLLSKWYEVSTDLHLLLGIDRLLSLQANNVTQLSWPPVPLEMLLPAANETNFGMESLESNGSMLISHLQLSLSREHNGNQLLRQEVDAFTDEFRIARSTLSLSSLLVSVYIISWILMTLAINDTRISNDISLRNILLLSVFGAIDIAASVGFVMVRLIMYSVKNNSFASQVLGSSGLKDAPVRLSADQLTAFTALRLVAMRSSAAYVDVYVSVIVALLTVLRLYAILRALTYYRRLRRLSDRSQAHRHALEKQHIWLSSFFGANGQNSAPNISNNSNNNNNSSNNTNQSSNGANGNNMASSNHMISQARPDENHRDTPSYHLRDLAQPNFTLAPAGPHMGTPRGYSGSAVNFNSLHHHQSQPQLRSSHHQSQTNLSGVPFEGPQVTRAFRSYQTGSMPPTSKPAMFSQSPAVAATPAAAANANANANDAELTGGQLQLQLQLQQQQQQNLPAPLAQMHAEQVNTSRPSRTNRHASSLLILPQQQQPQTLTLKTRTRNNGTVAENVKSAPGLLLVNGRSHRLLAESNPMAGHESEPTGPTFVSIEHSEPGNTTDIELLTPSAYAAGNLFGLSKVAQPQRATRAKRLLAMNVDGSRAFNTLRAGSENAVTRAATRPSYTLLSAQQLDRLGRKLMAGESGATTGKYKLVAHYKPLKAFNAGTAIKRDRMKVSTVTATTGAPPTADLVADVVASLESRVGQSRQRSSDSALPCESSTNSCASSYEGPEDSDGSAASHTIAQQQRRQKQLKQQQILQAAARQAGVRQTEELEAEPMGVTKQSLFGPTRESPSFLFGKYYYA